MLQVGLGLGLKLAADGRSYKKVYFTAVIVLCFH